MPPTSTTTRARSPAGSASAKKQKKAKQVAVEERQEIDERFAVSGHTKLVKLYSRTRCIVVRQNLAKDALEPRLAEIGASGKMTVRKMVGLTTSEQTKMLSIGVKLLYHRSGVSQK
jgi:hypothetical protein